MEERMDSKGEPWQLEAVRAFQDNYIWMLHRHGRAVVVDPGDCDPVFEALRRTQTQLDTILITHHHGDHVGGVAELARATTARIFGPARERMPEGCVPLGAGYTVDTLGIEWRVIEVPGHTAGHIAYVCEPLSITSASDLATGAESAPLLLCGDTLFSAGCGRLFEGTPAQMHASLQALAALPQETLVLCTHEYTQSNLRFARAVLEAGLKKITVPSVDNWGQDLMAYETQCAAQRSNGAATLPSRIGTELRINPFLRCATPTVRAAVDAQPGMSDGEIFAALRRWKDQF
jgi:hydroxyacylglutathione hydrolase